MFIVLLFITTIKLYLYLYLTSQRIINPTMIVDNAPAHPRLEAAYENTSAKLLRLAPYSYLLNLIELVRSTMKSHVKPELQQRMRKICGFQRGTTSIHKQRMIVLEQIANKSIEKINSNMLMNFANRV